MVDTQELVRYIKQNLAKGYKEASIKWALINQGHPRAAVERAMTRALADVEAARRVQEEAPKEKERPKIKYHLYDEHNRLVRFRDPFWKKFFRK